MNGVFGSRRVKAEGTGWEPLESRCVLSAASLGWDGPGQGSHDLTYYLGEVPSNLERSEVEAALQTALDAWSQVIDVEFTPTDRPNQLRSIDFSFVRLDGPGGTLAQAYLPADVNPARIAGDVQFDLSETWEVGNRQGAKAFDLVLVAVHELGHALGLDHAHDHDAVMAASVSALASYQSLAADDIDAALALYARRRERRHSSLHDERCRGCCRGQRGPAADPFRWRKLNPPGTGYDVNAHSYERHAEPLGRRARALAALAEQFRDMGCCRPIPLVDLARK